MAEETLPPHRWIACEGTRQTGGVPFLFCNRCDTERWADGTIRLYNGARGCAPDTVEYMEWMKANREKEAQPVPELKRSAGEQLAYMGMDGQVWAKEFMRINGYVKDSIAPSAEEFEHTLLSWFANAIEVGRTAGYSAGWNASAQWANRRARKLAEELGVDVTGSPLPEETP